MKSAQAADMIDVRVRGDSSFHNQPVASDQVQDARDFVTRIDHQSFASGGIANDRAIAMQHPYRDGDVNQSVSNGTECASAVAHSRKYIIGGAAGCGGHCVGSPIFDELFARLTLE